jgi:hypothetical protein
MTFKSIFFKMSKDDIRVIDHKDAGEFDFTWNEKLDSKDISFEKLFFTRVKNRVNLFSSYVFFKGIVLISHGPFISLYDTVEEIITKHQ